MNPPLASREDRDALIAGLADGTVDAIATDHAPHHPASKDVEFDRAPFGITGFETALALGLDELVHTGRISLMRLVELFTTGPARVLGLRTQNRRRRARRPHDFLPDHRLDVPRRRISQQIPQHALRRPRVPRRAHGHHRRRPHRLPPRTILLRLLTRPRPWCDQCPIKFR